MDQPISPISQSEFSRGGSPSPASPIGDTLQTVTSNNSTFDLHPIELTAHTLLSSSLDHLNENFKQLNQSQIILFTRLRLIEKRLKGFQAAVSNSNETEEEGDEIVSEILIKIKAIKKKLLSSVKTLKKVDARVGRMDELIDADA